MGMRFWFEKAEAEMQALGVAVVPTGAYSQGTESRLTPKRLQDLKQVLRVP
jgi:hypothetical protein